jgi:hypothetical protein
MACTRLFQSTSTLQHNIDKHMYVSYLAFVHATDHTNRRSVQVTGGGQVFDGTLNAYPELSCLLVVMSRHT